MLDDSIHPSVLSDSPHPSYRGAVLKWVSSDRMAPDLSATGNTVAIFGKNLW
jgi:hypothetical protein